MYIVLGMLLKDSLSRSVYIQILKSEICHTNLLVESFIVLEMAIICWEGWVKVILSHPRRCCHFEVVLSLQGIEFNLEFAIIFWQNKNMFVGY